MICSRLKILENVDWNQDEIELKVAVKNMD